MKYSNITKYVKILFLLLTLTLFAQDDYYEGISVESSTFVSDLQTLIRSDYVKLSYDEYDENMIPGFYAQDNGDGTKSVFCVYSNYEYIYSGTFTWGTMSREHTWCYSWMPTHGDRSTEEFSDYHHLFPVEQDHANAVRSNHPFGIVVDTISSFGEAVYGYDVNGHKVYEPRDEQKGDAARALFYMALKYNGIDGNDWTFNHLNNVTLPDLSEAPQDVDLLISWHQLDPPSDSERARNEYIFNLQHNRNPFIDHPEYVDYIDFNTMTKKEGTENVEINLFFSEYVEGSSYNKALEIYNNSERSVSFALGNYRIEIFSNGGETATYSITLSGEIQANSVFVIAHSSAAQAILDVANQTSGSVNFNGNDAIVLLKGSDTLDVIGQVGFNPGTSWNANGVSTYDATLRRKNEITHGDSVASDAFDPSVEWEAFPKDDFSDLGESANPVELVSFSAKVINNAVKLYWQTATEVNNYGFEIEKKNCNDEAVWEKIGFVNGAGNSNSPKEYSFYDENINSGKFIYRLKQIDLDGIYEYSKTVEVFVASPQNFDLAQNYPNPFNPTTTISYVIANPDGIGVKQSTGNSAFANNSTVRLGRSHAPLRFARNDGVVHVSLKVYDALGREVATLVNAKQAPGKYSVQFNATTASGGLPSGIYFYILRAGNFVQTRKMILMK